MNYPGGIILLYARGKKQENAALASSSGELASIPQAANRGERWMNS
jgi:hypothetical protein